MAMSRDEHAGQNQDIKYVINPLKSGTVHIIENNANKSRFHS